MLIILLFFSLNIIKHYIFIYLLGPVQDARQFARRAFNAAERVVSVDPGRNPLVSGVVHNQTAMVNLLNRDQVNEPHETLQVSKKEFYHNAGYNYRISKTNLWMSQSPEIIEFNDLAITAKTSDLEAYCHHAHQVLAVLLKRMAFFSTKRFKRLRWKTFIKKQQAYEKIVAKLKGGVNNTLVVWGDAKFSPTGRGSPAVPTKTLRKKVGERLKVIDQDEYRTSKLSCCCHTQLSGFRIDGHRSYHVRVCPNAQCPRYVWDRNTSAAINILYLFINYNVDMIETPAAFRRGGHAQDPLDIDMDE